jgi:hypothetical protein
MKGYSDYSKQLQQSVQQFYRTASWSAELTYHETQLLMGWVFEELMGRLDRAYYTARTDQQIQNMLEADFLLVEAVANAVVKLTMLNNVVQARPALVGALVAPGNMFDFMVDEYDVIGSYDQISDAFEAYGVSEAGLATLLEGFTGKSRETCLRLTIELLKEFN